MDITVIHIGAGKHNKDKNDSYKKLLKYSIRKENFIEIAKAIESSVLTNTGYGSSLNLLGQVECDASYINCYNYTIKQGALVGMDVLHPIENLINTYSKVEETYQNSDLSQPLILNYKSLQSIKIIPRSEQVNLVSSQARRIYDFYKDQVFNNEQFQQIIIPEETTDTIGVITMTLNETNIATSSGGNFFKLPGRIGCAGIIGSGIAFKKFEDYEISCMCSGSGEDIIKYSLANTIVNNILNQDYREYLHNLVKDIYVGVIVIIKEIDKVQLIYCHTTESFHFAFKVNHDIKVILSYNNIFTIGEYKLQ
ncbi:unnamed protein product [Candida verbasci]|uniref:Asparaginase n=1 Tax=Candida verbasci TaxID=1227364 RepID=A0A9W4TY92_9ASCO|nr:unnamed protein product [Candida verbasci]